MRYANSNLVSFVYLWFVQLELFVVDLDQTVDDQSRDVRYDYSVLYPLMVDDPFVH